MHIRSVKPGFFANDELAEIDPLGRLLFIGLWLMADRAGRLEDRPRRIKAEVLPYDACDVDMLLDQLAVHGFIMRYVVEGNAYVQIVNFHKHQFPNQREPQSHIPGPTGPDDSTTDMQVHARARTLHAPSPHDARSVDIGIGKVNGKGEGENRAPAREECASDAIETLPALSLSLVASSDLGTAPNPINHPARARMYAAFVGAIGVTPRGKGEIARWLEGIDGMLHEQQSPEHVPKLVSAWRAKVGDKISCTPLVIYNHLGELLGDSHASVPGRTSGTAQPAARTPEQEAQAAEDARRFQAEVVGLVHRNGAAPG